MADLSFYRNLVQETGGSSGGGTVTSNYDDLENKPVTNLDGGDVVLATLESGVYNIKGGFKPTEDSELIESNDDDLFYVISDGETVSVTWITGKGFKMLTIPVEGTKDEVVVQSTLTDGDVTDQLIGEFGGL